MHKKVSVLLAVVCLTLLAFTLSSAVRFVESAHELPQSGNQQHSKYRLVLITSDMGTPFWQKLGTSAELEAQSLDATLEIWGSYGEDRESFLKQLEIAIDSRVDGIIVQGIDTSEFNNLTKVKAAFYGIPIITVASDVPVEESLRKMYVGSSPIAAGQMLARQLVHNLGEQGTVVLMGDNRNEYDQRQRLAGIKQVLAQYPNIHSLYVQTPEVRESIIAATQDAMNKLPNVSAFISIDSNLTEAMVQEISQRARVESFKIYSFDDNPDVLPLLRSGKIDGILEQSPEMMGKVSVQMMIKWLKGSPLPIQGEGYLTDIHMRTAADEQ
ncbi:sugar ABC transporter substrate-binding protein [Paenibacillus hunanensis]|uniref:sugar ABC transporter substrate-binding protein n=1 Tax=Paenibacillus hunanensis TaxID=539262 RepID=UPI002A6A7963|nr:sugar ABC transporter substrate-binding protein [Paenibacillus hunanensis]WPP39374.1 sugar ABC transporter substrate-binding protein [Paenibacillus hunanensis]